MIRLNSRLICRPKCTKLEISIFVTIQAAERTESMEQKDSRFAVLIDADNVSPKYIKYILDEVSDQGVATYKRIYGDWTDISKKSWKEQLLRYSINPIQQYSNTNGKNSTDSAMIIDAMDILYSGNVEGFCLVSSDSDFTKLAQRLRESGMFVLGMGEQKTPSALRAMPLKFSKSFPRTRTISPLRLPLSRKIRRATALLRTKPLPLQARQKSNGRFPVY